MGWWLERRGRRKKVIQLAGKILQGCYDVKYSVVVGGQMWCGRYSASQGWPSYPDKEMKSLVRTYVLVPVTGSPGLEAVDPTHQQMLLVSWKLNVVGERS